MKKIIPLLLMMFIIVCGVAFATTITLTYPGTGSWVNKQNESLNYTITTSDDTVGGWNCSLYTNYNGTWHRPSGDVLNNVANSTDNVTIYSNSKPENKTGVTWGVYCLGNITASVGNTSWSSTNRTIKIDYTPVKVFPCIPSPHSVDAAWTNDSLWADNTPTLKWNMTSDPNSTNNAGFQNYTVYFNDTSTDNYSTYAVTSANITEHYSYKTFTLVNQTDWGIYEMWVEGHDVAGNKRNASNCSWTDPVVYRFFPSCSNLVVGWNVCGITDDTAKNASQICAETNCGFVAKYNESHEFEIYTNGSSTNAGTMFDVWDTGDNDGSSMSNASVFIYVPAASTWDNRSAGTNTSFQAGYFTNATGEGWNVLSIHNQEENAYDFQKLDDSINCNGTTCPSNHSGVFYNTTLTDYASYDNTTENIPYIINWTLNNGTKFDYGNSVWVHYKGESLGANSSDKRGVYWNGSDSTITE